MKSEDEEQFQSFETKIDEVVNILKMMNSSNKDLSKEAEAMADRFLGNDDQYQDKLKMDDFIVQVKDDRSVLNRKVLDEQPTDALSMGKRAFMAEMERDATKRAKERKEREQIAQNLRKLGNQAFHKDEYEKAINMYTKALDHIKDSFVIYNNRALAYLRLGLYKRAIIDCDFVIQKLDEKNIRSWLCRANAYYLLEEQRDFEKSITEAKKNNPKEIDYIEQIVQHIQSGKELSISVSSDE